MHGDNYKRSTRQMTSEEEGEILAEMLADVDATRGMVQIIRQIYAAKGFKWAAATVAAWKPGKPKEDRWSSRSD